MTEVDFEGITAYQRYKLMASLIVDPDGEIVVEAKTEEDELLVHPCDLDATIFGKNTIFNFALHRRIEHYGLITSRTGAVPPPEN